MTTTININKIDFSTGQIESQPITKSEIFAWYNRARAAARKGKGGLDVDRVNRALGYLLSGECEAKWDEYNTTVSDCRCKDHQYNAKYTGIPMVCKHRSSLMIKVRIMADRQAVAA